MTTHKLHESADLAALRTRLEGRRGKHFWRSLNELADTPEFRSFVEREFPQGASELTDPLTRRNFFKMMGASLALAGLTGCGMHHMNPELLAPYTRAPEGLVPGIPVFYASTVALNGYGSGVLVRSNEYRPTKIEGNREHPASLGSTDIFAQAQLLAMYDPERSQTPRKGNMTAPWNNFVFELTNALEAQSASGGAGLRILTETVTSPTLADQLAQVLQRFPQAKWYQYEPVNRTNMHEGARLAFGEVVDPLYDFSQAQVVLSLDADFLSPGPGFIANARAFANARRVNKANKEMNRLYVVESTPTTTGATAEHRLPLRAGLIESFARALAQRLGVGSGPGEVELGGEHLEKFLEGVVRDLEEHRGSSLILVGDNQPPALHALAFALNEELGNVGTTIRFIEPVEARPANHFQEINDLVADMAGGQAEVLLIIGGNPVYTAPANLGFGDKLANLAFSAHLSLYDDETSAKTTWHVNAAHFLEAWSDLRAYDGTASLVQPLIEPLYDGKTAHDLLAVVIGGAARSSYEMVRAYWQANALSEDFERNWPIALSRGIIANTASPVREVEVGADAIGSATAPELTDFEVVIRPDPTIWDGALANNGWLQETPKSITMLTWDNAVQVSPRTAMSLLGSTVADASRFNEKELEKLTLLNGEMLTIEYRGGRVTAPLWISPGHPDNSVTVTLGYGRTRAGVVGSNIGFDAYALRTSEAPYFGSGAKVAAAGQRYQLVSTQDHWSLEHRELYRMGTLEEFKKDDKAIAKRIYTEEYGAEEAADADPGYESLQPPVPNDPRRYAQQQWGMTINLNACIGCNACAVACQAENNIPVVGKSEVARGREMQWIRIDRYYEGENLDNPETLMQPVTCMQCEQAPCEIVCPVAATPHDNEGLNNMVYNRCVGTKYCSNNCPYKVRRFNFFQYADLTTLQIKLMRNPEVTVRNRGVMEKCSYCVQRISAARINAKVQAVQNGETSYTIADGAVVTACEAVCPTEAIVFGDIANPESRVSKWRSDPLNYGMMAFLNTMPRTTYITRVRNPNTELEEGEA